MLSDSPTNDPFSDLFPPEGSTVPHQVGADGAADAPPSAGADPHAATAGNDTADGPPAAGGESTADNSSWVESLYQTILDPPIESKSVTMLTESPINVATSSPTISQKSSPPYKFAGAEDERTDAVQLADAVADADSDRTALPSSAFRPYALPTLHLIRSSLLCYTELLKDANPFQVIPARTDYLVYCFRREMRLLLRPKQINECLAGIRKDKQTGELSDSLAQGPLLEEIRQLMVLSDKRRKSYNKKRSQRHQAAHPVDAGGASAGANKSGAGDSADAGAGAGAGPAESAGENSAGANNISAGNISAENLSADNFNAGARALPGAIPSALPVTDFSANPAQFTRSIRIGFCRKDDGPDGSDFVSVADYTHIAQSMRAQAYVRRLCSGSLKARTAVEAVYGARTTLTHTLTCVRVPLRLARSACSVDADSDRMVSYAEAVIDLGQTARDLELTQAGGAADFSSFVALKAVTRVYAGSALLMRKTDPVTGYFVSPASRRVRVMLPLQAALWAALFNDLHNGIIGESRFDELCITQTLFHAPVGEAHLRAQPIHTFLWDYYAVQSTSHAQPSAVTVFAHAQHAAQHAQAGAGLLRGHKRARSRSLNELDRLQSPLLDVVRPPARTFSGQFSLCYPPSTYRRPSDWSYRYAETPLATPTEETGSTGVGSAGAGASLGACAGNNNSGALGNSGALNSGYRTKIRNTAGSSCGSLVSPHDSISMDEGSFNSSALMLNNLGVSSAPPSATSTSFRAVPETYSGLRSVSAADRTDGSSITTSGEEEEDDSVKDEKDLTGKSHGACISNAGVARLAQKGGCMVESLKLRFDGNYKFRYYNPEAKTDGRRR